MKMNEIPYELINKAVQDKLLVLTERNKIFLDEDIKLKFVKLKKRKFDIETTLDYTVWESQNSFTIYYTISSFSKDELEDIPKLVDKIVDKLWITILNHLD